MKKRLFFFVQFVMILALLPISGFSQTNGRKKVAVVLSGGGAKGMAHIGVLKVLERAGIPVDIVTGTSMGSIIGGLYACGYNADMLDSLVRKQNWSFILSDRENLTQQSLSERQKASTYFFSRDFSLNKSDRQASAGIIKGKNLIALFRQLTAAYPDSMSFNDLPIPFACVATDIISNTEYDFHSGVLADAMRTSMSIPGAFAPVRKDSMLLVDGGLRNNYPADIAREMGADYIIGVTVQGPPKTADDLNTASAVLSQIVDVNCKNKYDENLAITDIPIRVNTKPYGTMSFTTDAIDSLVSRGEAEAMKHWDEIVALKAKLGLPDNYVYHKMTPKPSVLVGNRKIVDVAFDNMTADDNRFIRGKFHLQKGDTLSLNRINEIATSIRSDRFYNDVSVNYENVNGGYLARFTAGSRKGVSVSLGARFDTEEMAALQLNSELPLHTKVPLSAEATLRLGKRIMFNTSASFHPVSFSKFTLGYTFRHNDISMYDHGDKMYNITYNEHSAKFSLLDFNIRNFNFDIGVNWDYFHFNTILAGNDGRNAVLEADWRDEHYYSYNAKVDYNSENDNFFATQGARFHAGYGYYTDNFVEYNGHAGFSAIDAYWRMTFPISSVFSLQPMFYGRLLFGSEIPYEKSNLIGGNWFGSYIEQQMPFAGMGHVEHVDNSFIAAQLKGQLNFVNQHYILAKIAFAEHDDKLKHIFDNKTYFGVLVAYYLKTIVGPIGANLGWSNRTHDPYFYINLGYVF